MISALHNKNNNQKDATAYFQSVLTINWKKEITMSKLQH